MNIYLTSSLTPEDEDRVASAFVRAVAAFLDLVPLAYSIRVTTSSGQVLERTHGDVEPPADEASRAAEPFLPGIDRAKPRNAGG